jgi:hypothetical protein
MKVEVLPLVEFGVVCCRGCEESGLLWVRETAGCCAARLRAEPNTKTSSHMPREAKVGNCGVQCLLTRSPCVGEKWPRLMETSSFGHFWAILEDADKEGNTFRAGYRLLVPAPPHACRYSFSLTETSQILCVKSLQNQPDMNIAMTFLIATSGQ